MNKKIKVLMIAPISKDLGGTYTTGVCKVAEALMKQKYSNSILFLSSTNISNVKAIRLSNYKNQYNGYRYLIFDIIKTIILNPIGLIKELVFYGKKCHVNPIRFFFNRINIQKQINEIHPDIVHVHTTECPSLLIANKLVIPTIVTMHGFFYRGEPENSKMLDRLNNSVKPFKFFTGLTTECQHLMAKYLGLNKNSIKIIPNGINSSFFRYNNNERIKYRKKITNKNAIIFITVASVQPRKGQLEFIKILKELSFDWEYWIIGTGEDIDTIKDYCQVNKLTNNVKLFGHIENNQLYKYYSASDIYAHVSTLEGQALCEMEAYTSGMRIIINDKLLNTIATDSTDKSIYYAINMEKPNYYDLTSWVLQGNDNRQSRKSMDWQEVANMYDNLYAEIAKKYYGK